MKKISKKKHYQKRRKKRNINETIYKRYRIMIIFIILIFTVLLGDLFFIQIIEHNKYKELLKVASKNIVEGSTAPRGRIYDRNHKIIVDNEPVKVIYYKKGKLTVKEEIVLAYNLAELLEVNTTKLTENMLRTFWVKDHKEDANSRITEDEKALLKQRKLTSKEIEKYKLERVTEEELNNYSDLDKEAAYIYYLMNKGYSYSEKIIKNEDVTDLEYANVATRLSKLEGIGVRLDWNRSYPYGNTLRSILGTVSSSDTGIPSELKEEYLKKGYKLDDRVGTSYLEYQYDDYLRGIKNQYEILKNGDLELKLEGKRGNDLVITIDIELQQAVEQILEEELVEAKKEPNTEYYNRSFVIITDPKTGDILTMAGKQIVMREDGYSIYDYTPGVATAPVVVGSIIKGASHIVGYNTGALTIGEKRYDQCVKLAGAPEKCSWQSLGLLDDITALKQSSNTYQFFTALRVAGVSYYYDMPFKADPKAFETYRNTFAEFGLGVETGIDLPLESTGYKGKGESGGLLLDFSIGQYDNYTPLQLAQYMNTIANNGTRMKLHLLKGVYDSKSNFEKKILEYTPVELNKVNTSSEYMDRVQQGFKAVLEYGGTGSGYINRDYKPAGKTGTSQSFVDTDGDGIIDKETVTNTFAGYYPYDDPKVVFTVISPDTYHYDNGSTYQTFVNRKISKRVSEKYFELCG